MSEAAAAAGQQQPEQSDDTGCLDAETVSSTGAAANIWSCFIKSQFRAWAIGRLQSSQVDRAAPSPPPVLRLILESNQVENGRHAVQINIGYVATAARYILE